MASREKTQERALEIHRITTGLSDAQIEAWLTRMVDERTQTVVGLRRQGHTALEIGERFSVTVSRVYKVEKIGLRHIRYAHEGREGALQHFEDKE